jgi:hypothetical protein
MTLEDIRVGDIMLCPPGVERMIEQCSGGNVHAGDDLWFRKSDLRNPEFRVGDKVRVRGRPGWFPAPWAGNGASPDRYALVSRAAEKKPLIMSVWTNNAGMAVDRWALDGPVPECLATVKPEGKGWLSCFDGTETFFWIEAAAKKYADEWLAREGWVSEDAPALSSPTKTITRVVSSRCTLCGHPGTRHYAACEHNPEPKGTLISTLGWDQPAPIVVLCQNEEDVP